MEKNEKELAQLIQEISGLNPKKCMKCGKCSGACPAFHEMEYHPHQFVDMVDRGDVNRLLESKSIWMCLTCFACVERCPRDVKPANFIEAARLALIRQQGCNHLKDEAVPPLLDEEMPQQAIVSAYRKFKK